MTEGVIIRFQHNSGKIQDDDGKTYDFNRKAIVQGSIEDATPGRRVRFEPEDERARNVVLLGEIVSLAKTAPASAPAPQPQQPAVPQPTSVAKPAIEQAGSTPYRFLNPYNFVRTLEVRNPKAAPLLSRCAPPPHDRYVGLTGRVICRLTATTPIFVSDSEEIVEESVNGRKHRSYRFFRDPEGKVAIPGTSLRGAVRSIFEAATNSCFAHFAGKKRLSYHLLPELALRLVPARVRKTEDRWELELLPGTTPITPSQRPSGHQYAAWVHVYDPIQKSKTVTQAPNTPYAQRKKLSLAGYQHGEQCQAIIEPMKHPRRNFDFWNVVHLAKPGQPMPKPVGNQRLVNGYLCITNQNIENKHDERLFFTTQNLKTVELPKEVREKYEELIADYQERHQDEVNKRTVRDRPEGKEPAFSRFILERTRRDEPKLRDGDLVYAMLEERSRGTYTVKFIVPVSVPRVGFERKIGELLYPPELAKCTEYERLCPACRTFGWVWGDDDPDQPRPELDKPTAYAGRVRFSHAVLTQDAGVFDATLAILSAPKPTTYRFYLRPRNGKPQDGLSDQQVDYDNAGQILRGRKVYRHHGDRLNPQEYQSVNCVKSDQNRTVRGVQKTGSVFEFTVYFENLAPVELGALLWSLQLEGWHHRIGYAKPLGFGSARIEVLKVSLVDPKVRYASLAGENDGWSDYTLAWQEWVDVFKDAMATRYGKPFERLENIRDLRALLADTPPLPVHYPRPTRQPQVEGKQYEWFVGNKRGGQTPGPRLALPLAEEDRAGLPLIDRDGNIVNG
ncbi:TIGR03986 family type III CRISPR-associated RAMP protein [Caldilinea sp.]|jgi:CRISPR-associated protein (TIGR03986 family)|uniref:TIGR03986 family type III CRISPR-associated RAMP protein n=1 Tax=Caldilinea sp. TaxID=2293560 RepID=UPI00262F4B29|nr:TIGR03986 family CRISPR-associated RAMP protein [uncultured Caldilinea sp.]